MVFSSHPLYLDPPNWQYQQQQQQQQHQQQVFLFEGGNEISNATSQQQPPMQQPPPPTGGASRTIRPGSMTDRARMAKIPLLETALKCPRCESTNTKFCYFNNYSLTQPRHFCKTCRRYWTRGGALRNVPVGGGCRRATKRSSKKRSKSPAVSGTATNSADQNGNNMMDGGGQMAFFPQGTNQMGYEFPDHYTGGGNYAIAPTDPHITRLFQTGIMSLADSSTDQQWSKLAEENAATSTVTSLPQMHPSFPFMANFSQQQQQEFSSLPSGLLYQFDQRGGHLGSSLDSLRNSNAVSLQSMMDSTAVTHFADVKMEDGNKGLRRSVELQAQAAGSNNNIMTNGNNQLNWVGTGIGNAWSDLFGFPSNASSTGHNGL